MEKQSQISCKEEKSVTSKSIVPEEATLKQGKDNSIKMKTQKSTQVNVKMSPSQLHRIQKKIQTWR